LHSGPEKGHWVQTFQEAFYFAIFAAGEVMAVQGEKGATAYLLEKGEVEVLLDTNSQLVPLTTLKEGQKVSFEVTQGPKGKQASNIQNA
jgi:cold shock CspA family protein